MQAQIQHQNSNMKIGHDIQIGKKICNIQEQHKEDLILSILLI